MGKHYIVNTLTMALSKKNAYHDQMLRLVNSDADLASLVDRG